MHHWNVCVEHCLQLHPNHTMHIVPIHKVPTYAHQLNSLLPMVGAPLCAHHTPSHQPLAIFHTCTCTCSKPGCTATFGCVHPSMFPIAWRTFHHKPALVAPFILWLEYLLCAHHTHFPIFQLPGTHADPLFCQPGPFMACTPPCAPFCAPLCFTFPGLVTLI